MLQIENLHKSYDKKEVLHGITMEVEQGSIHGLVGENGSGKTTLMKCVTGIFGADEGSVMLAGEPVFENPKAKARIGYVADSNVYFPSYRLGKMVDFYEKVYAGFDRGKFRDLNQVFALDMNRRVRQLSKGQKMRLAFMLSLSANTDVLVMDEPTSGIDAIARKQLFEILVSEVEHRGVTVLLSSHHLLELEYICDAVTMIKDGRVVQDNSLDMVKEMAKKVNFVFANGVPAGFLQEKSILSYSNIGNIYTVIFSQMTAEEMEKLKETYAPIYTEELPINLEEAFVYTQGGGACEK